MEDWAAYGVNRLGELTSQGMVGCAPQVVTPDCTHVSGARWRLSGAVNALAPHEAFTGFDGSCPLARVTAEIENTVERLEQGLRRMREETDDEKRWEIAQTVGPLVGHLEGAFTASLALLPDDERAFAKLGTDAILDNAIAEFMTSARITLGEEFQSGA